MVQPKVFDYLCAHHLVIISLKFYYNFFYFIVAVLTLNSIFLFLSLSIYMLHAVQFSFLSH